MYSIITSKEIPVISCYKWKHTVLHRSVLAYIENFYNCVFKQGFHLVCKLDDASARVHYKFAALFYSALMIFIISLVDRIHFQNQ